MKLRLGAAVFAVALTTLTTAAGSAPAYARGTVDTAPPAVGSCHAVTLKEGFASSEPDPAVACTDRHTTVTTKIIQLDHAPNWRDTDALTRRLHKPCWDSIQDYLDADYVSLLRSAFILWWWIPTKAQRDAGAKWIRCDVGIPNGDRLSPLPTDGAPHLGSLPLPDKYARCRLGKSGGFAVVPCTHRHAFRASYQARYPGDNFPGARAMRRWAVRKCSSKINGGFYYEVPTTRFGFRAATPYVVCLKQTRA